MKNYDFVSWILVILGWYLVSEDQKKSQKRTETRALYDKAIEICFDVEKAAYEYYTLNNNDPLVARKSVEIKRDISRIAKIVNNKRETVQNPKLNNAIIEFRKIITGGEFDKKGRSPWPCDDVRFELITSATLTLVDEIEEKFYCNYFK